uniref:Uncharacterized protein n=1 Tax=Salmonella sp. TaxID=599 RepID=A0A482ET66_SALSP|nr:hypothetical protein NNIBIDOC_00045 [Salmonella sp.]
MLTESLFFVFRCHESPQRFQFQQSVCDLIESFIGAVNDYYTLPRPHSQRWNHLQSPFWDQV